MSRWDPKPPLDLNPWSLIPVIGLTTRVAIGVQVAWTVYVFAIAAVQAQNWPLALGRWVFGAWALLYITKRLGGRPAFVGTGVTPVRPDSVFQKRLMFDLLFTLAFVAMAVTAALGDVAAVWHTLKQS